MQQLRFLKASSLIVKIVGCIFLLLGLFAGIPVIFGRTPIANPWVGVVMILFYGFMFFFFWLVGSMAGILAKVLTEKTPGQEK